MANRADADDVSSAWSGGGILRKIGEDVTETLELIPRQWKVIQHVREKFSCRACEAITQPPDGEFRAHSRAARLCKGVRIYF